MVPFSDNTQTAPSLLKDSGSVPFVALLGSMLGWSLPFTLSRWLCILTLASGKARLMDNGW